MAILEVIGEKSVTTLRQSIDLLIAYYVVSDCLNFWFGCGWLTTAKKSVTLNRQVVQLGGGVAVGWVQKGKPPKESGGLTWRLGFGETVSDTGIASEHLKSLLITATVWA
jgi:hypothetical protein